MGLWLNALAFTIRGYKLMTTLVILPLTPLERNDGINNILNDNQHHKT